MQTAVVRRTKQELGLDLTEKQLEFDKTGSYEQGLHELGSFKYYKKFPKCAEYEIDHVFYLPLHTNEISLNLDVDEISEAMWISVDELKKWLNSSPETFTAWFPKALDFVLKNVFGDS